MDALLICLHFNGPTLHDINKCISIEMRGDILINVLIQLDVAKIRKWIIEKDEAIFEQITPQIKSLDTCSSTSAILAKEVFAAYPFRPRRAFYASPRQWCPRGTRKGPRFHDYMFLKPLRVLFQSEDFPERVILDPTDYSSFDIQPFLDRSGLTKRLVIITTEIFYTEIPKAREASKIENLKHVSAFTLSMQFYVLLLHHTISQWQLLLINNCVFI